MELVIQIRIRTNLKLHIRPIKIMIRQQTVGMFMLILMLHLFQRVEHMTVQPEK